MDKKTYEALKAVVELAKEANPHEPPVEIQQVENWIDEVSKEYEEDEPKCHRCGENIAGNRNGQCPFCFQKQ